MMTHRLAFALIIGLASLPCWANPVTDGQVNINSSRASNVMLYPNKALVTHQLSALPDDQGQLQVLGLPWQWNNDSVELGYFSSGSSKLSDVVPSTLVWQPGGLDREVVYRGLVGKSVELMGGGLNVPVQGTMLSYHDKLALVQGSNGRQYLVDWNDPQGIRLAGREAILAESHMTPSITAHFSASETRKLDADALMLSYVTSAIHYNTYYRLNLTGKSQVGWS